MKETLGNYIYDEPNGLCYEPKAIITSLASLCQKFKQKKSAYGVCDIENISNHTEKPPTTA